MKDNIRRPIKGGAPKRGGRGMKVWQVVLLAIVSAVVVVASFTALFLIFYKPNIGIGEPSPPPAPIVDGEVTTATDAALPPVTAESEDGPTRRKDFYTFLVLGRDTVGLNTDIIMLVSFDIPNGDISVMQIPRDTYVEVYETARKINSLYQIMHSVAYENGVSDTEDRGMRDMIKVLQSNMGIVIDNYALINLRGFRNIVDLIGGVTMDVPYDMYYDDPDQDLHINIKAGHQTLNGEKSEQFIRFRSGYVQGDIGRISAQKLFMTAMIEQVKSSFNLNTALGMISQVFDNLKTSMSTADLIAFAREFYFIEDLNINYVTFPGSDVYTSASYYVMKKADLLTLLNLYFNVYTEDISSERFDPALIFDQQKTKAIHEIYTAAPVADVVAEYVTNAKTVADEGIYIPLMP